MPCRCCYARTESTSVYCGQCRGTFHCSCGAVTCSCGNTRTIHDRFCKNEKSKARYFDFEKP